MKGTVVSIWLNTIGSIYGEAVKVQAMESVGWNANKIISIRIHLGFFCGSKGSGPSRFLG